MEKNDIIIEQTKNWVRQVVIGCNFCPFAKKELQLGRIHFEVSSAVEMEAALETFMAECRRLDDNAEIETTLLVFADGFTDFDAYLALVEMAEDLLVEQDYEGVYQVASFHPDYCFAGAAENDPANYTNRSLLPMLHLLREDSLTDALDNFPDPEGIPERNIAYAKEKGLAHMKALREACFVVGG